MTPDKLEVEAVEETVVEEVAEAKPKSKAKVEKKAPKTMEFEQDGVTWRKTYNAKGDVIKTESL